MKRHYLGWAALTAAISMTGGVQAFSQGGPPQGGGGGPHGGGGFQGGGGRRPMRGPGQGGAPTLTRTPLKTLASVLALTDDETAAIQKIQADFKTAADALRPPPPDQNGGGTPPDPATMDANRKKEMALEKAADQAILAVLTDTQKTAAAAFLKFLPVMNDAGIPVQVLGDLSLTDDQKTQITAVVKADKDAAPGVPLYMMGGESQALRSKIHTDVFALLTQTQQDIITAYVKAHPMRQTVGPGGGGRGGRGGGNGGPGGPDGGQSGPPHGGPGGPDGGGPGGPDGMPPPPDGGEGPGGPPPPNGN